MSCVCKHIGGSCEPHAAAELGDAVLALMQESSDRVFTKSCIKIQLPLLTHALLPDGLKRAVTEFFVNRFLTTAIDPGDLRPLSAAAKFLGSLACTVAPRSPPTRPRGSCTRGLQSYTRAVVRSPGVASTAMSVCSSAVGPD
jgi:hypothetical protein